MKTRIRLLLVGLASLAWLVVRSGRKPSRMAYPCQRAAAANVGVLVLALPAAWIDWQKCVRRTRRLAALVVFTAVATGLYLGWRQWTFHRSWSRYWAHTRSLGTVGKRIAVAGAAGGFAWAGIPAAVAPYTHRVVSVHDSGASTWTGSGNPASTMNQTRLNVMVEYGVRELTGQPDGVSAWKKLVPYQAGEAVAIKVNLNNIWNCTYTNDANMNAYAAVINAVIAGLKSIGVPSNKIWVTDPSRAPNDAFTAGITDTGVLFYTKCTGQGGGRPRVITTSYVANTSPYASTLNPSYGLTGEDRYVEPAQVFVEAAHLINVPQLKGHAYLSEVGGVTLGVKNHFGSTYFTYDAAGSDPLHSSANFYKILADTYNNTVFYNKTRLTIGDGIMGHPTSNSVDPVAWSTFGNQAPKTLFFGVDPVATDAVMFDYIQRECAAISANPRDDKVLSYAASLGLGVLEHWDNGASRHYATIDYLDRDLDKLTKHSGGSMAGAIR